MHGHNSLKVGEKKNSPVFAPHFFSFLLSTLCERFPQKVKHFCSTSLLKLIHNIERIKTFSFLTVRAAGKWGGADASLG